MEVSAQYWSERSACAARGCWHKRSGPYCWRYFSLFFFLLSSFRGPYFSTRKRAARVLKFCMGFYLTKIWGFHWKKYFGDPPYPPKIGHFWWTKGKKIKLTHEDICEDFKKIYGNNTHKNRKDYNDKKFWRPPLPPWGRFFSFFFRFSPLCAWEPHAHVRMGLSCAQNNYYWMNKV